MLNTFILLTLVSIVRSRDVIVGTDTEGRKIYDELRHASPSIWRQTENVTVSATDDEVISRIVITDLRPDKDGDAKIIEGGEGQSNVTIELKSPTVLRGYDFQIQVYVLPKDKFKSEDKTETKDSPTESSRTRVQRNPEEDRRKSSLNVPRVISETTNKHEPTITNNNVTPMSDDTKVNEDKPVTTNKDSEDVDEHKPTAGPIPYLGRKPQKFTAPASTTSQLEADKEAHTRQVRDALNPVVPEKENKEMKSNGNQEETKNEKSSTLPPALISRQGNNFKGPAPFVPLINKPANTNDGKRDERDVQEDKKSQDGSKSNEDISTQHPAVIAYRGQFNRPILSVTSTTKPEDVNDGKREVRDTDNDKKDNVAAKSDDSSTDHPVMISRQGSFNIPIVSASTNKPENIHDGKRDTRDTENDKKINDNAKSNDETTAHPPVLISRQGSFNRPIPSVSSAAQPESLNDGKREARDTENDDIAKANETTSTLSPALIARQGLFDRPTPVSTSQLEQHDNSKRDSRETDVSTKSDNTTPKFSIETSGVQPAQPRNVLNSPSLIDDKAHTTSSDKLDKTEEPKNEDTNLGPRGRFVPPLGYKRVSGIPIEDDKERVARDVEYDETRAYPPRLYTNVQTNPSEVNGASTTVNSLAKDLTTTVQPASNEEDNLRLQPKGVHMTRGPYQQLHSTSTIPSTTTKAQNKKETEAKVPEMEQKDKEDSWKNIPRALGQQNSTISEQKPVISIQ